MGLRRKEPFVRKYPRALLGLVALGMTASATAALGPTASPARADSVLPVTPVGTSVATAPAAAKVASYVGALQPNGWYCGPAATRIAFSAHGDLPSFDELAAAL